MSGSEFYWLCLVIISGRGGVGKTLSAMLLAVALLSKGRTPTILEADVQRRLEMLFPRLVSSIDIDQTENLIDDPLAIARAFSKILEAARAASTRKGVDLVVDTAATWHTATIRYFTEAAVPRKVRELGGRLVFLLPMTSDADSIRLAIESALKIEAGMPGSEIVFIQNGYPSPVRFDLPLLEAAFGAKQIKDLFERHKSVKLNGISPKIWGQFERKNMSVMDVATATPEALAKLAGADVDTAEIMKNRVINWLNSFVHEVSPLLNFRERKSDNAGSSETQRK